MPTDDSSEELLTSDPQVLKSLSNVFPSFLDQCQLDGTDSSCSLDNDNEASSDPMSVARVTSGGGAGIFKPNPKYALAIVACDVAVPKPPKFSLAIPKWKEAISKEFEALKGNDTWSLVKVKQREDGSIERFKVCLVANGMHQVEGTDYTETFSPVVHPLSIRLVLTLAVTHE